MTLKEEEFAAVGRIAIRDAGLTSLLEAMLWEVLDPDNNVGATITKGWNFARLLGTFRGLLPLRIRNERGRDMMSEWVRKLEWAHRERNAIVHSALVRLSPDDDRLTHLRTLPGEVDAKVEITSFNATALNYLADAMNQIAQEGLELFEAMPGWFAPDAPRGRSSG